jgi:hypothetical protein
MGKITKRNFSSKDFEDMKIKLTERFGKEANDNDIIWGLLNQKLIKSHSLHDQKMVHWEMARFLFEEGKNPNKMLKEVSKYQLRKFKDSGLKMKVRIDCAGSKNNSCKECQKLNDKIYTIKKALEDMPLPCKNCTYDTNKNGFSWCRCMWVAEI